MKPAVGLLGLGRMGQAIGARLLAAGYPLTVYNRTSSACAHLASHGARVAATPAEAATPGGIALSVLTDEAALRDVCVGPAGLLRALAGGTHLSLSTLSPVAAHSLSQAHSQAGVRYVSSPVQGRPPMALVGQLVAWVSGPALTDDARGVLEVLSRRLIRLGDDVRQAAAAKLALNLLMNGNIALFAEAFAYVHAHSVNTGVFGEGLTDTVFSAPLFKAIASALASEQDAATGSDVNLSRKDLSLLLGHGKSHLSLPVASALRSTYAAAADQGWGGLDPIAVRRLARNEQGGAS